MKLFSHPNIVQLKEVLASKTKIYMVLELVTGGELFDEIVREVRFTESKARYFFKQLLDGVDYCHDRDVCHRDLKPENLLLDDNQCLKISDFGLSALYTGTGESSSEVIMSSRKTLLHTTCGTPSYVAPEILEDEGYNGKLADIWSLGVILYVLCAGCLPFDEKTLPALFNKIQQASYSVPAYFTQDLQDLLSRILVADPKSRASIKQIKEHPWTICTDSSNVQTDSDHIKSTIVAKNKSSSITGEENSTRKSIRMFNYRSSKPPHETLTLILSHLREMNCAVKTSSLENRSKVKASKKTSKGVIGMIVSVESDGRVDIRRGKGDIMEYYNFFNELTSQRLGWIS